MAAQPGHVYTVVDRNTGNLLLYWGTRKPGKKKKSKQKNNSSNTPIINSLHLTLFVTISDFSFTVILKLTDIKTS